MRRPPRIPRLSRTFPVLLGMLFFLSILDAAGAGSASREIEVRSGVERARTPAPRAALPADEPSAPSAPGAGDAAPSPGLLPVLERASDRGVPPGERQPAGKFAGAAAGGVHVALPARRPPRPFTAGLDRLPVFLERSMGRGPRAPRAPPAT